MTAYPPGAEQKALSAPHGNEGHTSKRQTREERIRTRRAKASNPTSLLQ